jgi:hypothetical protein
MSFLDFAAGFAGGFADELERQGDIQREEDQEIIREQLAAARAQAQTYSERRRAHEQMLQHSHQLHRLTGVADPGAFFELQQLGFTPANIVGMVQENPNVFQQMGVTTRTQTPSVPPAEEPMPVPFEQGAAVREGAATGTGSGLYVSPGTRAQYTPSPEFLNISMDFNASPRGNARGTEVIIPDNAGPEVRAAAERFNTLVAEFAHSNGIADYPIRGIRTTSENGRGIRNTVHAEPFFNTDLDMQRAIEANPAAFAQIYGQAFGGLSNARLIAPHGVGRDRGATSSIFGDETSFGELMALSLRPEGGSSPVVARGSFNPVDMQMADSGLAPAPAPARAPAPMASPAPQPARSPAFEVPEGLQNFRSGVQRAFGMDPESRQARIDDRVARGLAITSQAQAAAGGGSGGGGGGFASPPTNFSLNLNRPADLSGFPSIAAADNVSRLDGIVADAEARGFLNRPGADQWLASVEARRATLNSRTASSYLNGVTNADTALAARNRALADIENGVIPPESADAVMSAIDRTISDFENYNWSPPETESEARTRLRVAQATGDTVELERLIPYIDALAPPNVSVTNVIVRPTDGGVGTTMPAIQEFNTETGQIEYRALDGRPLEAEGNLVIPIDEDIRRAAAAVQGDNQISVMYRNGTQAIADLSRYVVPMYELAQLMESTPEVTTYASQLSVGIDSFFRDARSMIGLLEQVSRERDLTPQEAEAALRQNNLIREGETLESIASSFEQSARSGVIENMADARRAYEAYVLLGTFRTGGIEGQEGRAVSNRLFEELQNFMRNARNVDQLRDRVRIQIDGMAREVGQTQQSILNHPQVRGFIREFGYNPVEFGTLEGVLQSDPRLAEATEYFLNAPVRGSGTQPTGQTDGAGSADSPTRTSTPPRLITEEDAARNPLFAPYVGRTVVAVPTEGGRFRLEIVD